MSQEYSVWYADNSGAITGATTKTIAFRRKSDGYWWNFTTGAFAASVSGADGLSNLTEVVGTVPVTGVYTKTVDHSAWGNGEYEGLIHLAKAGKLPQRWRVSFYIFEGVVQAQVPSPPPPVESACVVYDYAFHPDDVNPPGSLSGTATIVSLPYHYNDRYHAGDIIPLAYTPATGLFQWTLVRGASVRFVIADLGIDCVRTIPASATALLHDLSENPS